MTRKRRNGLPDGYVTEPRTGVAVRKYGVTTGLRLGQCIGKMFHENELLAFKCPSELWPDREPGKPLTDEELRDWLRAEFPDRPSERFLRIRMHRREYNIGAWPRTGHPPELLSYPYDEHGHRIYYRRGASKPKHSDESYVERMERLQAREERFSKNRIGKEA